jgi:hypothetical protein
MSDDLREREPDRTQGDDATVDGTRSDQAGTGTGIVGPAPAGGDGGAVPAGGGDGSTGDRGGPGDSEGRRPAGSDPQTEWLRSADGAPADQAGDEERRA